VLLASGGHCILLVATRLGQYRRLGTCLDDAPGEAFDKVARMLALEGGGPALEALASEGDPWRLGLDLKVPLRTQRSCDFSFSGLKTAVSVCASVLDRH